MEPDPDVRFLLRMPASPNQADRGRFRWAIQKREQVKRRLSLALQLYQQTRSKFGPFRRLGEIMGRGSECCACSVRFIRWMGKRQREWDDDNFRFALKPVLDLLKREMGGRKGGNPGLGVILDDSPALLAREYEQRRAEKGDSWAGMVEILVWWPSWCWGK